MRYISRHTAYKLFYEFASLVLVAFVLVAFLVASEKPCPPRTSVKHGLYTGASVQDTGTPRYTVRVYDGRRLTATWIAIGTPRDLGYGLRFVDSSTGDTHTITDTWAMARRK